MDEAARLLRNGTKLDEGRHPDLVGKVDCEFRPVDPKWIKHLMGWAEWYYDHEPFPVLQAVYPDLENRFPGEDGFNEYFTQPLLQPGAPMTTVDQDFWASNDPKSGLFDWPFNEGPHTGAYLSKTVHEGTEPIVFVSHDPDGDWQFLGDSMSDGGGPVVSCFHHPVDADASLKDLADLLVGWCAERAAPGEPWIQSEMPKDEQG